MLLSIDPSIVKLGFAVFDNKKLIFSGTYKTKKEGEDRYKEIAEFIENIIKKCEIKDMCIEYQYLTWLRSNAILKTSRVSGICQWVFSLLCKNGKFVSIAPAKIKKLLKVKGKRKEAKKETILKIKKLYPHLGKVDDNTADAIALWLVCIFEKSLD